MSKHLSNRFLVRITIAIAALGYFVDMYDIILFNVVRRTSLLEIGVPETDLLSVGINVLNWQLVGMIAGGIIFGIIGDKFGRLSVLFGSIILYSLANIANGLVTSLPAYAVFRFIAGVGLAGELGAGITLVSETMKPEKRGYGTMLVATIGVLGASFAALVSLYFHWRTAYFIGGGMGLLLLLMRVGVSESPVFKQVQISQHVKRGDFMGILRSPRLLLLFFQCIIIGAPTFFTISVLASGATEFGKAFGLKELPRTETAIMILYIFVSLSDILCSLVSQWLKSRRVAMFLFLGVLLTGMIVYLFFPAETLTGFYIRIALLGFGIGIWAVLVTTISEQFGTNIRATATTSIPNFVRAFFIPLSFLFKALTPSVGIVYSAAIVGIGIVIFSAIAIYFLPETFGRDLNFNEDTDRHHSNKTIFREAKSFENTSGR
ncbi:MAG: MFS transporter [Sediminibacterium sp.]